MLLTNERLHSPLRIWALLGARPGDNDQVIALAEALDLPFEIKPLEYNSLRRLGPRLLGCSLISLTKSSRESLLKEPPPDLTISTGHRSVAAVRWLRRSSGGQMRSVHIGFPRVSPGHFDLVVATPQYPIADHPSLLRVPFALTRAATAAADPADMALVSVLPSPRRLLIVGGPTLFWDMDEPVLLRTLSSMLAEANSKGGSVLVTTSARTPRALHEEIARMLEGSTAPSLLVTPGQRPLYASLLSGADSIRISADSVSMVSDAIWTGKPLALVPVVKSKLGWTAFVLMDRLRPGKPIYPQDLRFFWRALADVGITERLGIPRTSTNEEMRRLIDRIRAVH